MSYCPCHTNLFGFEVDDDIAEERLMYDPDDEEDGDVFTGTPFELALTGEFDGSDCRIHGTVYVLCFKAYSDDGVDYHGNVMGTPSADEIFAMKQFCEEHSIPWKTPERIKRTFIL